MIHNTKMSAHIIFKGSQASFKQTNKNRDYKKKAALLLEENKND
jgi:hypothetical protein